MWGIEREEEEKHEDEEVDELDEKKKEMKTKLKWRSWRRQGGQGEWEDWNWEGLGQEDGDGVAGGWSMVLGPDLQSYCPAFAPENLGK